MWQPNTSHLSPAIRNRTGEKRLSSIDAYSAQPLSPERSQCRLPGSPLAGRSGSRSCRSPSAQPPHRYTQATTGAYGQRRACRQAAKGKLDTPPLADISVWTRCEIPGHPTNQHTPEPYRTGKYAGIRGQQVLPALSERSLWLSVNLSPRHHTQ